MVLRARGLVLAAALTALAVSASYAPAQDPSLPRAPVPVVAGDAPGSLPPPSSPTYAPIAPVPPPPLPPVMAPPPPPPGPLYATDRPGYQPPQEEGGLYFGLEADIIKPHVKNRLSGSVVFDDLTSDLVQVQQTPIDWTVAPRLELGYRFPDNTGAVVFTYRFFGSDGRVNTADYDGFGDPAQLHSRLSLNSWDLDYVSEVWEPFSQWQLNWKVGIRLADVYFDSQLLTPFLEQHASNSYFGAGPHLGLDLWRPLGAGFAITSKVEGAGLIGRVGQGFSENFVLDDGSLAGAATHYSKTQAVPMVNLQVGLGWAPLGGNHLRISTGYQYEHWWAIGDVGNSHAEVWDQGAYLRGEINY